MPETTSLLLEGDLAGTVRMRDVAVSAKRVAQQVDAWGEARAWTGSDPYDAGNGTRVIGPLQTTKLGRQLVAQLVKRSPLDLRPLLGVPPGLCSVTLAHVVAAHALGRFLDPDAHHARLRSAVEHLNALRLSAYDEPAWGYYWDAQSRATYYPRTEPNGIATAFAGHALFDAYGVLRDPQCLELAFGAADWFFRRVPRTAARGGAFFGYHVGNRVPVHNANLLACSLLARAAAKSGRSDWMAAADEGVAYTLAHQRSDGAWWYGETGSNKWVDGFHTGYVLEALHACSRYGVSGATMAALDRGFDFYRRHLFLSDGTPRYYDTGTYPIDAQNVAQGIQTFAIGAARSPAHLEQALLIYRYALRSMWRGGGRFLFQRRRFWVNPTPHMRWVQSPMLRALAHLLMALDNAGFLG